MTGVIAAAAVAHVPTMFGRANVPAARNDSLHYEWDYGTLKAEGRLLAGREFGEYAQSSASGNARQHPEHAGRLQSIPVPEEIVAAFRRQAGHEHSELPP